jgi:hypothetical protein
MQKSEPVFKAQAGTLKFSFAQNIAPDAGVAYICVPGKQRASQKGIPAFRKSVRVGM